MIPSLVYEIHGMRLRSEIPLGDPVSGDAYDIAVQWSGGNEEATWQDLRVLADASLPGGLGYRHAATTAGFHLHFPGACDVLIDTHRRALRVRLASGADPGIVPILLEGNVLAMLLLLGGASVLHASAISLQGAAVAFVGPSGVGKSTLAAACCAARAEAAWLSDDLLRVESRSGHYFCYRGSSEVRLRHGSAYLARLFPTHAARTTADGRLAVRMAPAPLSRLAALVALARTQSATFRLERLTTRGAWKALMESPRVLGLRDQMLLQGHFHTASGLAQAVPAYRAELPGTAHLDPAAGAELLAAIGLR